ncbi:MAG: type II toxin-antitoxin system HicB family antitoxin [Pyrinomonadaceae bacterium]|nr:type II toxin-antitoxin system HicB family antitoxin [Pyrinomonadaceae bacterium]
MKKQAPVQVGEYSFTILVEANDPDGYLVTCPALPGLVTEGETLDEAFAMAKDAIEGYLISLVKHGDPIPEDKWAMPIRVKISNEQVVA